MDNPPDKIYKEIRMLQIQGEKMHQNETCNTYQNYTCNSIINKCEIIEARAQHAECAYKSPKNT